MPGEIKTVGGDWNQQQRQLRVPGGQTQTQAQLLIGGFGVMTGQLVRTEPSAPGLK